MNINELKRLYNCAKSDHEMWHKAYTNELENTKRYFLDELYEEAKESLKEANIYLELSANAREEIDKYEKELRARHAKY